MNMSWHLAFRLRQSVQGCTLHLHGPVQAWAAVEKACEEGLANRTQVAQYVIDSCSHRIDELLASGIREDDQRVFKEKKTRAFVERLLLDVTSAPQSPVMTVATIITHSANQQNIVLVKRQVEPYGWELPSGFAVAGEAVEETAKRQAFEGTGLKIDELSLSAVETSVANTHLATATVVFSATSQGKLTKSSSRNAEFFSVNDLPGMVFGHDRLVAKHIALNSAQSTHIT